MGMYNIYGENEIQIKAGERTLTQYHIGDKTDLPDGIYIGYEGAVVIREGKMIAESRLLYDKWGGEIHFSDIIDARNIINDVVKKNIDL